MNTKLFFSSLLIAIICGVTSVSCSSDDDNGDNGSKDMAEVVWALESNPYPVKMDVPADAALGETYFKYDKDGTIKFYEAYYNKNMKLLHVISDVNTSDVNAEMKNGKMVVTGGSKPGTYTRKSESQVADIINYEPNRTFKINNAEFKMIKVLGGTFTMGCENPEEGVQNPEIFAPEHQVTLSTYYIAETEATQGLWMALMDEANPSVFVGFYNPVDNVSWLDCQQFITKLNDKTGEKFSLPTEAQWEFAARGGSQSKGFTYAGSNNIRDVAWFMDNSSGVTHVVKSKTPNELGIYDMCGNVIEWCLDGNNKYTSESQIDPVAPLNGGNYIMRGGSWKEEAWTCLPYIRWVGFQSNKNYSTGFRLALAI